MVRAKDTGRGSRTRHWSRSVSIVVANSAGPFTTAATMTSSPPKVDTHPTGKSVVWNHEAQTLPSVAMRALPAR